MTGTGEARQSPLRWYCLDTYAIRIQKFDDGSAEEKALRSGRKLWKGKVKVKGEGMQWRRLWLISL